MDVDIELGLLGESAPLLGEQKIHKGYGASKLPIKASTGSAIAAGSAYQKIFEGQLGRAAGDPNNPLSKWFHKVLYGSKPSKVETSNKENVSQGLVLPFSHNIGPGNIIKEALNEADKVAQGHDLHYQYAKGDPDVLEADKEAISHFIAAALQTSDPIQHLHGLTGALGLGIKSAIEHIRGSTLYGKYAR